MRIKFPARSDASRVNNARSLMKTVNARYWKKKKKKTNSDYLYKTICIQRMATWPSWPPLNYDDLRANKTRLPSTSVRVLRLFSKSMIVFSLL